MKKYVLGSIAASLLLAASLANAKVPYRLADYGWDFAAPVVSQAPSSPDTINPVGSIIYDSSSNTFKGLYTTGWAPVSQGAYAVPTVQRFTSGSGTYTKPAGVLYIRVKAVGAGGGGAGAGTTGQTGGGAGSATTFGTSLIIANGGSGGQNGIASAAVAQGGSVTINTPATAVMAVTGGSGQGGSTSNVNLTDQTGGSGGNSPFGGGGGSFYNQVGGNGVANTGGGGAGGGAGSCSCLLYSGGGGGAGGYAEAIIANPSTTYTYTIGTGGNAGGSGPTGQVGGTGGSGVIIVEEYYQ